MAGIETYEVGQWEIIWLEKALFYLDGAVNSQNFRMWSISLSYVLHQQTQRFDYVTAWCGFNAEFILGIFIFETFTPQGPDALPRMHVTANFFNSRSFLLHRKDNVWKSLYAR
ncbi:hypothetical protein TNCV_3317821 [Trichonephila clavipes]|nr:hypothetical protein TNCV_3317821 [Trichonephila clavipes]